MSTVQQIAEVWRFRTLVWALTRRHLAARYRGSMLGFLWSLLNPLALMLVYTLVFSFYMKVASMEHYAIFVFCGLLPWLWMTSGLNEGTSSIVSSGHLITKSMFPAQILPVVSVLVTMLHFLFALPILLLFMLVAGMPIPLTALGLPVLVALQFLFLVGLALTFAALNVRFRDVQHIVSNLLTFLFFLCPIVYPSSVVPEKFRFTLELNPFALFTVLYHQLIFEGVLPSLQSVGLLVVFVMLAVTIGSLVFSRHRESFAELL
jgi:lipopolysaccharide transport system permease protein